MMTEIRAGILKAFDSVTWTATVQLTGSLATWLAAVPVARNVAQAELVAGRRVAVALIDPSNPADTVVVAVWT